MDHRYLKFWWMEITWLVQDLEVMLLDWIVILIIIHMNLFALDVPAPSAYVKAAPFGLTRLVSDVVTGLSLLCWFIS